jgi:two-component system chemotaxis response regulator CheB
MGAQVQGEKPGAGAAVPGASFAMKKIAVLVVDDSAVVRRVVTDLLAAERDIEVIAACADPILATERMGRCWPDVIVLDIEMPRMDGITFLKTIMAARPTPVIICSTLTEKGAEATMQALASGALGIVTKPKLGIKKFLLDSSSDLVNEVRSAARANLANLRPKAELRATAKLTAGAVLPPASGAMKRTTERIVAIGTSTGGTQALEAILTRLPRTCPGLVIVQHMPEKFTASFAERLDRLSAIEVKEAQHNDRVIPGRALIAPGARHMLLKRSGAQYHVDVVNGPLVRRHRPSVDVLFRSVAKYAGANAAGIIMTGMGDDGAAGLLEMKNAGARTFAQDEESCVVYGMPREAVKLGAVEKVVSLADIPREIAAHA